MINEETIKLEEIKKIIAVASTYLGDMRIILLDKTINKINAATLTIMNASEVNEEVLEAYLFLKKNIPSDYFIQPKEEDSEKEETYHKYSIQLLIELCISYLKDFGDRDNDLTKIVRYSFSVLINDDSTLDEIRGARFCLENELSKFYGTMDIDLYQQMCDKLDEFKSKNR